MQLKKEEKQMINKLKDIMLKEKKALTSLLLLLEKQYKCIINKDAFMLDSLVDEFAILWDVTLIALWCAVNPVLAVLNVPKILAIYKSLIPSLIYFPNPFYTLP